MDSVFSQSGCKLTVAFVRIVLDRNAFSCPKQSHRTSRVRMSWEWDLFDLKRWFLSRPCHCLTLKCISIVWHCFPKVFCWIPRPERTLIKLYTPQRNGLKQYINTEGIYAAMSVKKGRCSKYLTKKPHHIDPNRSVAGSSWNEKRP